MKGIRRNIISIMAAILALATVSCQKDDTLYYNNMTMGNIVNGKFISDQGNTFNVVEQVCEGKLEEQKRAMVLCDVLNETDGASDEYDVRLTDFAPVLEKDAVAAYEATSGDIAVKNPIYIDQFWYSGGYMNMFIRFHVKSGSETKHLVNLVWSKDDKGRYVLEFRHNAFGEVLTPENMGHLSLSGGGYVSFPVTKFIEEDEATIILKWKWYKNEGINYNYSVEEEYSVEYEWKRRGFEQTPQALTLRSSKEIR